MFYRIVCRYCCSYRVIFQISKLSNAFEHWPPTSSSERNWVVSAGKIFIGCCKLPGGGTRCGLEWHQLMIRCEKYRDKLCEKIYFHSHNIKVYKRTLIHPLIKTLIPLDLFIYNILVYIFLIYGLLKDRNIMKYNSTLYSTLNNDYSTLIII